jgi:hypothetical protein
LALAPLALAPLVAGCEAVDPVLEEVEARLGLAPPEELPDEDNSAEGKIDESSSENETVDEEESASEGEDAGVDAGEEGATEGPGAIAEASEEGAGGEEGDILRRGAFFEHADFPIRRVLRTGEIVEVEKGHGGRTLAFRLTFADGSRGYYKPEQSFSGAHWYAEIAAYVLDRELGIGRVPPVVTRSIDWELLRPAAEGDRRLSEIHVQEDGTVRGSLIWWIPNRLARLRVPERWDRHVRVHGFPWVTPFQRPRIYADQLAAARASGWEPYEIPALSPLDRPDRAAELSDMIVFDYLTHNIDRWGGGNTNVRTLEDGGPLVYLDNGAGFSPRRARVGLMDGRLHVVQRFRRSTIEALRRFSIERYRERIGRDQLAPVLTDSQIDHLEIRRQHVLEHVEQMIERYGERVYAW